MKKNRLLVESLDCETKKSKKRFPERKTFQHYKKLFRNRGVLAVFSEGGWVSSQIPKNIFQIGAVADKKFGSVALDLVDVALATGDF